MTSRKLLIYVCCVAAFLIVYAVVGGWLFFVSNEQFFTNAQIPPVKRLYGFWKDLTPVAVAIPLAILTFALQRRISYIQALRDLWKQLLPIIQSTIQYTHLSKPGQADFAKVQAELSVAIDAVRSVFRNVPNSKSPTGLYPYENLKDIKVIISWIGYDNDRVNERERVRQSIIRLWQEMFAAMLEEFDRDVPLKPVSKYLHTKKSIADFLIEGTLTDECLKKVYTPSRGCSETVENKK
jgi:uncharacterized membrane protein